MLMVAQGYSGIDNVTQARAITEEVVKNSLGDAKEQAQAQLRKLNMLGKPLELSFKSLEGKQISMKDFAGKVVLVDFWATWCGPCRAALPEVKAVYNKYHDKGFEILGISFDKEKEALTSFIKEENLKWPQYFDGLGWDNKLGQKFEISSIPTVWLVDKQGKLRHLNAGENLAEKVGKLLAEK
jgi:thiol-disulfide isomerase/thioredoxin